MTHIGERCIECDHSVAFGSGRYVNRIPADDGERAGWMCAECQAIECDCCGGKTLDWTIRDGEALCEECEQKHPESA